MYEYLLGFIGLGRSRLVLGLLLYPLLLGVAVADINVTTTADEFGSGAGCALREAIQAANTGLLFGGCSGASAGADVIRLPAGDYRLTLVGAGENANATGDLDIDRDVNILGVLARPDLVTISASTGDRVFDVRGGSYAQFDDLTIQGGQADQAAATPAERSGGGLRVSNHSQIVLFDVITQYCTALDGGAIFVDDGSAAALSRSALVNNDATRDGGAVAMAALASFLQASTSTLSGNRAGRDGGAVASVGTAQITLLNLSIIDNQASAPLHGGGGAYVASPALATAYNSVMAGNVSGGSLGPDCAGGWQVFDYGLLQNSADCVLNESSGSLLGVDPGLSVLGQFGGHTWVHHPRRGSALIDAASGALPSSISGCAPNDQRGKPIQGRCDIGAVQFNMDFSVNRTDDAVDTTPGDGQCAALGGGCTLRAAVQETNAWDLAHPADFRSIALPASAVTLSISGRGEAQAATGDLNLNGDINLIGDANSSASVINAAQIDRVLDIHASAALLDLGLLSGDTNFSGGGLLLNPSAILFADNFRISAGTAGIDGGGLMLADGTARLAHCAIFANHAMGSGGGVFVADDAQGQASSRSLQMQNCTLANNLADQSGGGLWLGANVARLAFTTLAGNLANSDHDASGSGGGLFTPSAVNGLLQLNNSLVSGNQRGLLGGANQTEDCAGGSVILRHKNWLSAPAVNCVVDSSAGSALSGDPLLQAFDSSGAHPTFSFALSTASPAIAAIPFSECYRLRDLRMADDQRHQRRGLGVPAGACSIGAYEYFLDAVFANGFEQ
jgi:CSLREA domain-containing protein